MGRRVSIQGNTLISLQIWCKRDRRVQLSTLNSSLTNRMANKCISAKIQLHVQLPKQMLRTELMPCKAISASWTVSLTPAQRILASVLVCTAAIVS